MLELELKVEADPLVGNSISESPDKLRGRIDNRSTAASVGRRGSVQRVLMPYGH